MRIARYTGTDVDETTMTEIDEMLRQFFALDPGFVSRPQANTIRRAALRQRAAFGACVIADSASAVC